MNNRLNNPNEYRVTNNLGKAARSRHSSIMNRFILTTLLPLGFIYKLDSNGNRIGRALDENRWKWGTIGPRIGSRRSADGMLYTLPNASMTNTNNNNVVIKIIFAEDESPKKEVAISKILSAHRIGPRIFECYSADIDMTLLMRNIGQNKLSFKNGSKRGQSFINLFQSFTTSLFGRGQSFSKVYMLVMENLYKNPSRGVTNGFTISDIIENKPGARAVKIPYTQLTNKFNKMHELGIIHGDMHAGNIIVQVLQNNKFGVRIIDFGRSINTGRSLTAAEANSLLTQMATNAYGRVDRYPGRESTHVITRNGMPRYLNGAAKADISRAIRDGRLNYSLGAISGRLALINSLSRANFSAGNRAESAQRRAISVIRRGVPNAQRQLSQAQSRRANVLRMALLTHQRRLASAERAASAMQRRREATVARRRAVVAGRGASTQRRGAARAVRRNASLARRGAVSAERRAANLVARGPSYARRMREAERTPSIRRMNINTRPIITPPRNDPMNLG